ncbi:MAG: hypothetical protein E7647_08060 [Ruminococcaceae bacterium]|nr:hypothetical protein [Oscillospiraceae bacterium]
MKKIISLLLCIIIAFSLCACGEESVDVLDNGGTEESKFGFLDVHADGEDSEDVPEETEAETLPETEPKPETVYEHLHETVPETDPPQRVDKPVVNNNSSYTVYITETGEKYHRTGCRHLNKSMIPISRDEAVAAGYTPCSVCDP